MSNYRPTLIIESFDQDAIQMAFKLAEACFNKVSPVTQTGHAEHSSFIIASTDSKDEVDILFEEKEQLDFIDWCEKQNVIARKEVLIVKRYYFDVLRLKE